MTKATRFGFWTRAVLLIALGWGVCVGANAASATASPPLKPGDEKLKEVPKAPPVKPIDELKCYACHTDVEKMHVNGRHATVNCAHCHDKALDHLKEAKQDKSSVLPETRIDHGACATCHREQYNSFVQNNLASKARVEKASFKSRSPLFDKLMQGYGFTIEHSEPRSHAFMLVDHLLMDRTYGGRFQLKDWTYVTDADASIRNMWEVLTDKEPSTSDQKKFLPQTVTAANPVCLNCKTADHILKWKYMGDPDPRAKWNRTSKVVDFVRDLKHPLNCFMCHDPHTGAPRVVRDALIEAVVDRGEGTYPQDKAKSEQTKINKVTFKRDGKDFRSIGLLSKSDSNIMCAQCHVEYNCGLGFDVSGAEPKALTYADRRTNLFFWTNVFGYKEKAIAKYNYKDFKHAATGALLPKIQHPEMETYWGSKHERAGVECKDCHMPKVKGGPDGKSYTWHGQRSARYMKQDTCVRCHQQWSPEESEYQIDAIQNYIRGKMTKAEFWLAQLIDAINKAKEVGVAKDVLDKAFDHQYDATLYWEWWTAENSDGFHNPDGARESLSRSIDASQNGIKLLKEAMGAMTAAAQKK